jgi:hypothetical protein
VGFAQVLKKERLIVDKKVIVLLKGEISPAAGGIADGGPVNYFRYKLKRK